MALHRNEWPGDVVERMTTGIIKTAQAVRNMSGVPLIPSPVEEAHARRIDGTSRHAIGADGSGLADATDLFLVDNKHAATLWQAAQRVPGVGGFGMYFDTVLGGEKRVLIHIDNRPERLLWLCPTRKRSSERRTYIYFRPNNPGPYLDLLCAEFSKL